MRYPSICFVAQKAYGVLAEKPSHYLGGVEVQIPLMARWFVERNYDVTVITWDEGYGAETTVDGIRVISLCREADGLPWVRFFTPRWTSLNAALKRANPDVVYYNYGDMALGQIALWAKPRGIPLIFSVPNDKICEADLPTLRSIRERELYQIGLHRSDFVIAQTEHQKQRLAHSFDVNARVIPMPSTGFEKRTSSHAGPREVLWVGRFTDEKRLEWMLDIAEALPHLTFRIVGGASVPTHYSTGLEQRARQIENVILHGRVEQPEMGELYQNAWLLCSTSVYEGFPNVFLEAWSTGLPTVATVNPDGILTDAGLGRTANTQKELIDAINEMSDDDVWRESSEAAWKYFDEVHRVDRVMDRFREVIDEAYALKVQQTGVGLPPALIQAANAPTLVSETSAASNATPRFSLVTATYKRPAELRTLLASIIKQLSVDPERYEHIICDNASNDDTRAVVEEHLAKHDDIAIRYYCQSQNWGLDKNIQDALALARGDYVWFVADDDDVAADKLKFVADTCEEMQVPLLVVRANKVADWEAIPRLDIETPIRIKPDDPRWGQILYSTSFLASMVFNREQIHKKQPDLTPVFGTNYTPWALGLRIMDSAEELGYVDELCTLGNANFDGNNRFPPYRTLIKGRVQVWSRCSSGAFKKSLEPHLFELTGSGWRALAAGRLDIAQGARSIIAEYIQVVDLLGPRVLASLPWILITLTVPLAVRKSLDNLRKRIIHDAA